MNVETAENNPYSTTLVICTYHNAALLKRTLEVSAQLLVPARLSWSVLVVNNNCSDSRKRKSF
ncbi:MAG TPA: hypothetical protein VEY10_00035 [Flavisolibacter sp.]|jgi:hypothetical protein|nr:hypothetical protein [Flavisolibacter sp.]